MQTRLLAGLTVLVLLLTVTGLSVSESVSDTIPECGIYSLTGDGPWDQIVVHRDLSFEVYGKADELPGNAISLGYIESVGTVTGNELISYGGDTIGAITEDGIRCGSALFAAGADPVFFPSSQQLADSGLTWENDLLGTLVFRSDGSVLSDLCDPGTYDLGVLRLAGRTFYLQRSIWSESPESNGILSDLILTLYETEGREVTGRLLLIQNGEMVRAGE